MKLYEPQPARLIYAYDKGWKVMGYVWKNVFARTNTEASSYYKRASAWKLNANYETSKIKKFWIMSAVVGAVLAGTFQYLTAIFIVVAFILIQFSILISWMFISTILIICLSVVNFIYGSYHKIFYRCPYCHVQMDIPIYVCPNCATEHSRLWPSVYGVFHHRCNTCKTNLPTLDIVGRKKIVKKCVACNRPLNKDIGSLINLHIPIVGGPSTGKSNFIFMALYKFIEEYAPSRGYKVEISDEKQLQEYQFNLKLLLSGKPLLKTTELVPDAYNISIKGPGENIGKIVYFYDPAGEAYLDEDSAQQQGYQRWAHGILFIIDPFSIELFRQRNKDEVERLQESVRPSQLDVRSAYERMLTVLETRFGLERGKSFNQPIAVVLTKIDALSLDEQIGRVAAKNFISLMPERGLEVDAVDLLVRQFLIDNQLDNLVRDLQLQFENVKFFSCSALGRIPDKNSQTPFDPVYVIEPVLWLFSQLRIGKIRKERITVVDRKHRGIARGYRNKFKSIKYYFWGSLLPTDFQDHSEMVSTK
jgi:hypothetical protein